MKILNKNHFTNSKSQKVSKLYIKTKIQKEKEKCREVPGSNKEKTQKEYCISSKT